MIRGYYTAASGLLTQEKNLNNIANNITNASTVGFKRDTLVMGTFGEHMTRRMNAYQQTDYEDIGPGVYMQVVDEKYTNYAQGGFEQTTRPLDMSIMGDGFFIVANDAGEEMLSRDGQFSLDEEGYLVLPGFGRVQGENGDMQLSDSSITVDGAGNVYIENEDGEAEQIDRLLVGIPDDNTTVKKIGNSLYTADSYTAVADIDIDPDQPRELPVVRQYHLEQSNVNMSDEMTRMMASQRSLQSCSQIVKMYDELAGQIASQVSKV